MKKFLFALGLVFSTLLQGQNIVVNNNAPFNNPFWLAQNVLVDPNFNVYQPFHPVTGLPIIQPNTVQVGVFNAVGTPLGLDSGIVMATDNITVTVPGFSDLSTGLTTPDTDLRSVLTQIGTSPTIQIKDKVEISFSFIATSDFIEFRYVFASREYKSFTCSSFNDVFGFFLTGTGINGSPNGIGAVPVTVNLATIPNTNVPVAINTINQGFPSGTNATPCLNANPNYVAHSVYYHSNSINWINNNNTNPNSQVNMAGWTVPLTAKAQVVCGNSYTIKLKLADASDGSYNSAVFIEANSFKSPEIKIDPIPTSNNSFIDSQVVEGCKPMQVVFEKDGNINQDMTILLDYFGNAIPGVDYAPLPDSVFIPAGISSDTIEILAYNDGLVENNDSIVLYMKPVYTSCYLYPPQTKTIHIRDKQPVNVSASLVTAGNDTIYCPGDTVGITGSISGGEGILESWWDDDPTAPATRVVQPSQTTTYYFYATDECHSDSLVDSVTIYLIDYTPMVTLGDTLMICRGDTVQLISNYSEGKAPYVVEWYNQTFADEITAIPTQDSTWYSYTVTDACGQSTKDSILVWIAPDPSAGFNYFNDPGIPLRVNFSNSSLNAFSYLWDFGDGETSTDTIPEHSYPSPGDYMVTLTIVSEDGCIDSYTNLVKVETDFYLYIPTAFTPDGDGLNEFFEVKGMGFEKYQIAIFNRWGNQVYYSEDIAHPWDGNTNGELAPQGIYTYAIFIQMPLGDISEKHGSFTLFR